MTMRQLYKFSCIDSNSYSLSYKMQNIPQATSIEKTGLGYRFGFS